MTFAWHSNPDLKADWLCFAINSRRQDRFSQRSWVATGACESDFRGCHIGCLGHHAGARFGADGRERVVAIADTIAVPEPLLWLFESIFESLPASRANLLTESVLDAIPVGADLTTTIHRINLRILCDEHGCLRFLPADLRKRCEPAVECVRGLARGDEVSPAASAAAWAAARDAAWAAARDAASDAASAAARDAASAAAWERIARWTLLELASAPVPPRERVEPEVAPVLREIDAPCEVTV